MATILTVATEGELRAAIFQVSNDFANGVDNGPYTIDIVAEFLTLTQSLPMIRGTVPADGSAQITIIGNGFIDANFSGRVFFVESGAVAINGLVILNARAEGGAGGDGASSGGAGGGGLGAGAAVFVNDGAVVTLTNVQFDGASAVGGAGGDGGALGIGFGFGSGGGGGLGGNGGSAGGAGSGGGGGYAGTGGHGSDAAGGGGGGATAEGGYGLASGGGGGAGQSGGPGGNGGLGGGGGGIGDGVSNGGFGGADGGEFGGGGGMGNDFNHTGGNGGFGGGGGAPTSALAGTGGDGGFGAGGGSGTAGGASLGFGGQGGSGSGADGGGGAALGGAVFVRDGGTLIINDGNFAGSYGVTGGTTAGAGGATAGQAHGSLMFLHGGSTTTFNVSADNEVTFGVGGSPSPTAGTGGIAKTGLGTLIFGQVHGYTGATLIEEGFARVDGSVATSAFTIESGATLGGGGTTGAVSIQSGGALAPGASVGTLTIAGSLTSTLGTTYRVEIAGTAPGAFDLVNVTGTASLGNATLDLALFFDPTPGNSFTILQAAGGVSGTFFGLADLAQFSVGDDTFQIDYTATTVVLTTVSIPLTLTGLAPSVTVLESAADAQPQILDADVALTGDSFANGSLTVSGLLAGDRVGIRSDGFDPGQIGVDSGVVFYGGVAIGTVAGGVGADLTVAFNGSASKAAVEAVIEHLTYFSAAEPPAPSRTLTMSGDGRERSHGRRRHRRQRDGAERRARQHRAGWAADRRGGHRSPHHRALGERCRCRTGRHDRHPDGPAWHAHGRCDRFRRPEFQRDHRQRHRHRHADRRPHRHQHDARRRRDLPRRSELQRSRHGDDDLQRRRVERRRSRTDRRCLKRGGHRQRLHRRHPGGRWPTGRDRRRAEQCGGRLRAAGDRGG